MTCAKDHTPNIWYSDDGERIGTYSGRSRLRDTYWARQAANEFAVEEARRRLQDAFAIRNALR